MVLLLCEKSIGTVFAGLPSPNPAEYSTYRCEPLSLLTGFQVGRPGRKLWRGSCVNHIQGKEKRQTVKRWKIQAFRGPAFFFGADKLLQVKTQLKMYVLSYCRTQTMKCKSNRLLCAKLGKSFLLNCSLWSDIHRWETRLNKQRLWFTDSKQKVSSTLNALPDSAGTRSSHLFMVFYQFWNGL